MCIYIYIYILEFSAALRAASILLFPMTRFLDGVALYEGMLEFVHLFKLLCGVCAWAWHLDTDSIASGKRKHVRAAFDR